MHFKGKPFKAINTVLLWLKLTNKTMKSDLAKTSQHGPGSNWAGPILTRNKKEPRSQFGLEHFH